jgi:23S rRNA (uridine2552-2'-O)-methyltransferase
MAKARPDSYYQRAKKEGYAARSVYKLKDMDRRYRLLGRGLKVLDLGCHPGSWLQYTSAKVGPKGLVVGVDIQPLGVKAAPNVRFVQADMLGLTPGELSSWAPAYDLVLSDAAPRTTGVAHADVAKSLELAAKALELGLTLLRPGGNLVAKAFFGDGTDELIHRLKAAFKQGKAHKPPASKTGSREIYLIGLGRKTSVPGPGS